MKKLYPLMPTFMVGNAKIFNILLNYILILAHIIIIIIIIIVKLADVFCTPAHQFSSLLHPCFTPTRQKNCNENL